MATATPLEKIPRRVNELDLFRFVAALMVVVFHYGFMGYADGRLTIMNYPYLMPLAKYGGYGVELFFMLSGFVILMTASGGGLSHFIASRFTRLYPIFWICCSLTFATTLLLHDLRFAAPLSDYLVNLTMISEVFGVPFIDGVYWTLVIELTFYFLLAGVLLFRQIHRTDMLLHIWLALTIVNLIFPALPLDRLLITRYAPLFIGGATCYLIYAHGLTSQRVALLITVWLIATYQALENIDILEQSYHVQFDPIVVAGLITLFFALFFCVAQNYLGVLGRRRWLSLGLLTYPLYLLHQYIGYMIFNVAYPTFNRHVVFWGTLAFMLLLAYSVARIGERITRSWRPALERNLILLSKPLANLRNRLFHFVSK